MSSRGSDDDRESIRPSTGVGTVEVRVRSLADAPRVDATTRIGGDAVRAGAAAAAPSIAFGSGIEVVGDGGPAANAGIAGSSSPPEHTLEIHPWTERDSPQRVLPTVGSGTERYPLVGVGAVSHGRRYRIVRELGRGGMGVVWEAWDMFLERSVAIKSLEVRGDRPAQLQRFLREAKIASRLNHPGIMAVHEFGITDDGQAYMVMRVLRGQTLRMILDARQHPGDDQPRLLAAFLQACQAVAAAHDAGIIHRDLKPANIMVGEYSLVTVMDWGLAKVLDDPHPEVVFEDDDRAPRSGDLHTACGTIFGTPGYLAPEQARGEIDRVDRRTDVFGLGCILCEILTGQPPFRKDVPADAWRQSAEGDTAAAFERLRTCGGPEPVLQLARRCLAADRDLRPADAGAIVDELVAYFESGQRRAEQQLVRFFDLSVDLFCVAGLDGYFRRVNGNFLRLLGYTEPELLTNRFVDFVHPSDREATLAEVSRLSRGETTLRFRNRYLRADGDPVWLEWSARAEPEEGVIYAVARDVTERVRLETELEKSRHDVEDFMENANVPLHRVDSQGIIVWANRAELDFLGYALEEYVGQPIARFHADQAVIGDILARLGAGESLSGYGASLVAKDGSIRTVTIHSSVYSENGVFRHTRCLSLDAGGAATDGRLARAEAECAALRERVVALEAALARR